MERTGQGESGKFEGGIFSGMRFGDDGGSYDRNAYAGSPHAGNAHGRNSQGGNTYAGSPYNGNGHYRAPNYCRYGSGYNGGGNCGYNQGYNQGYNDGFSRHVKERKSDNTALIFAAVVAAVVILIAFFATILCLVSVIFVLSEHRDQEKESISYPDFPYQYETVPEQGETVIPPFEEWGENAPSKEADAAGEYYGELQDAVRTDLDYFIEWENFEYEGNNEKIMIAVDYPVIKGDMPNKDVINDEIKSETEYFIEYYEEYSKYMLPDETFGVYSEGYVTYMDEEVMSVVFRETIYTDYGVDCGLFCINIDVENGVILDNNSILKVDEEFVNDFRRRSKAQNGEVNALSYMTDQELASCLSTMGTSILFYTPVGMEVGVNYGEDYLTVTYADYEKFLLKY